MQNRKIVAKARPLIEKTPTATIASTSVQADLLLGSLDLIYIVLDTILGYVSGDGPGVGNPPGVGPLHRNRKLAHVRRVTRIAATVKDRITDAELPEISHALAVGGI